MGIESISTGKPSKASKTQVDLQKSSEKPRVVKPKTKVDLKDAKTK